MNQIKAGDKINPTSEISAEQTRIESESRAKADKQNNHSEKTNTVYIE